MVFEYIDESWIRCTVEVFDAILVYDPDLMIHLDYLDSNKDLVADPTLLIKSLYSSLFSADIINASDAVSIDLGGGNRALGTARNASSSLRARHEIVVSNDAKTQFDLGTGITVIKKFKRNTGSSLGNISIASNTNIPGVNTGFAFQVLEATNQLRVRIQDTTILQPLPSAWALDEYHWLAFTYDGTTVKMYWKSNLIRNLHI